MSEQPENGTPEEATAADQPASLAPDPPTVVSPEPAGDEPAVPAWTPPPPPPPASASPSGAASGPAAIAQERPEVAVGAAFAGGFVLALILKRLAH